MSKKKYVAVVQQFTTRTYEIFADSETEATLIAQQNARIPHNQRGLLDIEHSDAIILTLNEEV